MLIDNTATLGRLTTPHWKGHAASSPSLPSGDGKKIVFSYVSAGVKVSVNGVAAMFTDKMRLVMPVRFRYVTALATFLGCVARVKIGSVCSLSLRLILYKLLKLSKVPAVQPSSVFLSDFDSISNTFKFFKNNNVSNRNKTNNFFSYFVVYSSSKPFLFLRELLKMSLCRKSAFRLETASDCLVFFVYSPYMSAIKKFINLTIWSGYNRKFFESQVHANNETLISRFDIFFVFFYNKIEKKLFGFLVIFQGSRLDYNAPENLVRFFNTLFLKSAKI